MQSFEHYRFSPVTGCLLTQPTTPPQTLVPFYELLKNSHDLFEAGKIREAIEKLPTLDTSQLGTHEEKRLAHMVLAFLAAQYVWQDGKKNQPKVLPAVLAKPLVQVSHDLGCQPILSFSDYLLTNCFPNKSRYLQRQSFTFEFFPSRDLNWLPFFQICAEATLTFTEIAKMMMFIIKSMSRNTINTSIECLNRLANIISIMREQMLALLIEMDPMAYFTHIRPLISEWPKDMVYEGVGDSVLADVEINDPKVVYGGAIVNESIILESLDAFLGIEHIPDVKKFFSLTETYMIREHRSFIEDLRQYVHLRNFVEGSGSEELKKAYNSCVEELVNFKKDQLLVFVKLGEEPLMELIDDMENPDAVKAHLEEMKGFFNAIIASTKAGLLN